MDPARWATVKRLFHEALDRPAESRASFVSEACGADESLRLAVEAMLSRAREADGFLESPALEAEALAMARDLASAGVGSAPEAPVVPASPTGAARSGVEIESPDLPSGRYRVPAARPPWWMWIVAAVFLADVLIRTWCYALGPELFGFTSRLEGRRYVVASVTAEGLAERSGLQPGDVLVTLDGRPFERVADERVRRPNREIGREHRFEIERGAERQSLSVTIGRVPIFRPPGRATRILWQLTSLVLLATSFLIAFKRPRDAVARTGALMLAALSVSFYLFNVPPGYAVAWRSLPWGLGTFLWIPNLAIPLFGPIGLTFFVLFPRPVFRSRWPWILIWLPALAVVPAYVRDTSLIVYYAAEAFGRTSPDWVRTVQTVVYAAYGLGMLVAISVNYVRLIDFTEKRRLRVMLAGGMAGTVPALARLAVMSAAPQSELRDLLVSGWPDVVIALLFLLFPVSFAYAVLRHRLLGVRVIVRLGVQYALARGMVISLLPVLGLILVADALIHGDRPLIEILRARGSVYALLASLAVVVFAFRHRMSRAIDRRFFHEQYDASQLLREIAEQGRRAGSLERAGSAVVARIESALHPQFAALLLRPSPESPFRCVAVAPSGLGPPAIQRDDPVLARLRAADRPLDIGAADPNGPADTAPDEETGGHPRAELLVPIAMNPEGHEALLALGAKRSQEPYTREDLDSLAAIAASLALLLERPTPPPGRSGSAFEECPRCGSCYDSGASLCASEQAPLVSVGMPRTLAGRYRLDRRLGRGGMGKVYEALDVALDRRVAVKVIRDEWVQNRAVAARFRREARVVASLIHPNVVTVYDFGIDEGARAFLVMERLCGVTLREELRAKGRLDAARAVAVLRGVCGAVDAAHRHHLVHRDLKPENVFLVDAGRDDGAAVKVLDFGVVKPLPGGDEEADPDGGTADTELGVLVGTVGYLSPEQLMGERPGVSWDLWALAVVAYESLTGAPPFPLVSTAEWRQAVLGGRFTPVEHHLPDAPIRCGAFFARALAVDRSARPVSAAEFAQAFEAALD